MIRIIVVYFDVVNISPYAYSDTFGKIELDQDQYGIIAKEIGEVICLQNWRAIANLLADYIAEIVETVGEDKLSDELLEQINETMDWLEETDKLTEDIIYNG